MMQIILFLLFAGLMACAPTTTVRYFGSSGGGGSVEVEEQGDAEEMVPVMHVRGLTPGETAVVEVTDGPPGQSVLLFGGRPTDDFCGTRFPREYRPLIGEGCLAPANAKLLAPSAAFEEDGTATFEVEIPTGMPLGEEVEFQAVLLAEEPALTAPLDVMIVEGLACEVYLEAHVPVGVMQGAQEALIGAWQCYALGGDVAVKDLSFTPPQGLYESYTIRIGATAQEVPREVGVHGVTVVLQGEVTQEGTGIGLFANVAEDAECGAEGTPSLNHITATGAISGASLTWGDKILGTTTHVVCP